MSTPKANTDRELYREGSGDGNGQSYYEPSVHVTAAGQIGMNVGGTVVTLTIREWHAAALTHIRAQRPRDVYAQQSDGTWKPAEPLPWLEEHSWPARVVFWLRGVSHCGKTGWRDRREGA